MKTKEEIINQLAVLADILSEQLNSIEEVFNEKPIENYPCYNNFLGVYNAIGVYIEMVESGEYMLKKVDIVR